MGFPPKYAWLSNNECINLKTRRTIKQCYVYGSIGYVIDGKFKSLTFLQFIDGEFMSSFVTHWMEIVKPI